MEFLQEMWGTMVKVPKFNELKDVISAGLQNMDKWYRKTNDTNVYLYALVSVLYILIYIRSNLHFQRSIPVGNSCIQNKSGTKMLMMWAMNN
jgi:hypothetical protein